LFDVQWKTSFGNILDFVSMVVVVVVVVGEEHNKA
jgi:hypothetical protein